MEGIEAPDVLHATCGKHVKVFLPILSCCHVPCSPGVPGPMVAAAGQSAETRRDKMGTESGEQLTCEGPLRPVDTMWSPGYADVNGTSFLDRHLFSGFCFPLPFPAPCWSNPLLTPLWPSSISRGVCSGPKMASATTTFITAMAVNNDLSFSQKTDSIFGGH